MNNINDLKNVVSNHIANSRLEQALNCISENDQVFEYSKKNEVVLLMSSLNRLKREERMGTSTSESLRMARNRIVFAILDLCGIKDGSVIISEKESDSVPNLGGISFRDIKKVLKSIRDQKGKIDYSEAIDVLSDLF